MKWLMYLIFVLPMAAQNVGLPNPPSNAVVYNNIDDRTSGWGSCNASNCAGGRGDGTYWMAQNQSAPSLDGASTEFYVDGVYDDALFYNKLGSNNSVHNFLWDFYFQLDSTSLTAAQALEFDAFQFVSGYNYMMGSECNYAAGVWDTWNESTDHWVHTTIPCVAFTPGVWHHLQYYLTTDTTTHQYSYHVLVVDGRSYPMNQTYSAKDVGWSNNSGVQWQLDVNNTGLGYHEWIDSAKLTVW